MVAAENDRSCVEEYIGLLVSLFLFWVYERFRPVFTTPSLMIPLRCLGCIFDCDVCPYIPAARPPAPR